MREFVQAPLPGDEVGSGTRPPASPAKRPTLEPLLTLRETAALLSVSEKSVRRLVANQRIPCLRVGRQLRFVPSDLLRWVSARREGG